MAWYFDMLGGFSIVLVGSMNLGDSSNKSSRMKMIFQKDSVIKGNYIRNEISSKEPAID